jgi:hypothetical protein
MKKIIDELINDAIEGVDTYFHNGSMWLIFTDRKQWVIELDKHGKLWYNYYLFMNLFNYVSLDVVENQHYITMWVEDIIQNGVKGTSPFSRGISWLVEDIIQNGVRSTLQISREPVRQVEDVIQNGNLI